MDDFSGLEGCNEILNVTRPDIANRAEYDIPDLMSNSAKRVRGSRVRSPTSTRRRSLQLTEALAEETLDDVEEFFELGYRGARFSLGYGACPTWMTPENRDT